MANPKLEFFRFKLNHKSENSKTFRQFMVENGKATSRQQDSTIFANLFKYVMEKPVNDFEKNDSLKKVVTLIGNKKINKHFDERPKVKYPDCIISGVVNGGPFGKERILTNLGEKKEASNIQSSQPVLQYYYIFLYLPLDHNEGFLMVHSDSAEETITQAYRKYVAELFKLGDYKKTTMQVYVPKHFRDEYKDGAVLQSISFANTEVSADMDEDDPLREIAGEYEVKITFTPKGEARASFDMLESVRNFFMRKRFGTREINKGLDEFRKCSVSTKNEDTNTGKIIEWNNLDQEILPVVYLKDRVAIGDDGTPVFSSLDTFCHDLFKNQILPEIRPDLNVERVDDNA
jgi:hypothetical protein